MHLFRTTLGAILPLFALVFIGYLAKKRGILQASDAQVMSRFVVELALPALIIDAFVKHRIDAAYFKLPVTLWVSSAVSLAVVLAICRIAKTSRATTGAMILVTCFGNTGYMGYPITTALFPSLLPATVICDQLGMSLLLYPGAVLLGSLYGRNEGRTLREGLARFAKSPLFLSLGVGVLLATLPPIPNTWRIGATSDVLAVAGTVFDGILAIIHVLGAACIPVILIAIGLLLRPSTLRSHWREVTLIGVLKLAVAPVIAWLAGRYLMGLRGELLTLCVLESAVPTSAAATVLSGQYEMDGSLAVASFFALTIASGITIPLALTLLR